MKVPLYNIKAEIIGDIALPDALFNRSWNPDLVHQTRVMYEANARIVTAHTKTRGEVRGGGKKPWRQKGTGRARHGSTRSPIWVGGGVTFGPRSDKQYKKKMNKKMRRAALASVLSKLVKEGNLKVIQDLSVAEPKTKEAQKILSNFFGSKKRPNTLLVTGRQEKNLFRAAKNIPRTDVVSSNSLNTLMFLKHQVILVDRTAVDELPKSQNDAKIHAQ